MDGTTPLFLLIRDSYGHWGFPKGHLESGEPADSAARREVMEEAGLADVRVVAPLSAINWFFRFEGSLIHKDCQFFLMESASAETTPQAAEGITECRWATIDEANELIVYANARKVLNEAHAAITGSGETRHADSAR